ncbi:MAG: thioesterase family protein [Anaerolineae bacterium]|nr:thioesterase family protein [Anaerolineae bacterium]
MPKWTLAPEQLLSLPRTHQATIPPAYLDEMGHMNVMYYVHLFDRGAWGLFAHAGITFAALQAQQGGMFALQQFIQYLAEVHAGQTLSVYSRVLGVSARRLHFVHILLNDSTGSIAATQEVLAAYADLTTRRTADFPAEAAARLAALRADHAALPWAPPLCGLLSA